MEPDNGREIITIHSMQTRQGKTKMMEQLEYEYNQWREGSCLKMTAGKQADMANTIKDFRHTLELLIIDIGKAKTRKGSDQYLMGMYDMLEHIKNGSIFSGKWITEIVRFKNRVKIIICGNDMHKPDDPWREDRDVCMDIHKDAWEWVPHVGLQH